MLLFSLVVEPYEVGNIVNEIEESTTNQTGYERRYDNALIKGLPVIKNWQENIQTKENHIGQRKKHTAIFEKLLSHRLPPCRSSERPQWRRQHGLLAELYAAGKTEDAIQQLIGKQGPRGSQTT